MTFQESSFSCCFFSSSKFGLLLCLELDEVVRLLKSQGIELGGKKAAEGSEKVSEKEKVWARHQEKKPATVKGMY